MDPIKQFAKTRLLLGVNVHVHTCLYLGLSKNYTLPLYNVHVAESYRAVLERFYYSVFASAT